MKFSIITVTLNAERFLPAALESFRLQDFPDCEHLIIDGNSTDRTMAIVREYAAHEPRVRFWTEPDAGIADAMNKGLRLAIGEYVGYLHADDYFADASVLSRVAADFSAYPEAIWGTGGMRRVDFHGREIREYAPRRYSYRRLLRGNIIFHPATFVRRETLTALGGFSPAFRYAMDYDVWLRLGRVAAPLMLSGVLTCFRVHRGSISCRHAAAAATEEWEIRKGYLASGSTSYYLHYLYYLLKRAVQVRLLGRHLNVEGIEHA